ncbi:two-component system sensor histidine kinase QseC [Marinobacterium halophilum]|uniref:histidine kinase n=1 Tax=Marinobacterium halophilum TaxID=267374 RepID=A0A2P8F3H4_9GAMM|nr:ATP-binding protein [Marinobacterium halophilum]PSL16269.1 two-component system sensor histidine kinase QseC [Marinobacterium halophilum]
MTSIRRALSISLLSIGLGTGLLTASLAFFAATDEAEELFDAQMAQMARLTGQLAPAGKIDHTQLSNDTTWAPAHPYEKQLSYRIIDAAGNVLIASPSFPEHIDATPVSGYRNLDMDGIRWRLFTLPGPANQRYIQVAQDDHIRRELALKIALTNTLPILVFLPLFGFTIWWLIGRNLLPLVTISREVTTRSSDHLEPLALQQIPDEIDGLVRALNALLARLQQSFERERRFTADAAHELRTPLAALQIHCENLYQDLNTGDSRTSCAQMLTGIAWMNRMVEQLLQLSRLDPQASLPETAPVNLNELCRELISDQIGFAIARHIDLGLDAPEQSLYVRGNAFYLRLMLRNLIDNALRYTPPSGEVTLLLESSEEDVALSVVDSGPGLDAEQKQRVFERFYRQGENGTGSGLGLSIVRLIADLHQASITLLERDDDQSGLVARVTFGKDNTAHKPVI